MKGLITIKFISAKNQKIDEVLINKIGKEKFDKSMKVLFDGVTNAIKKHFESGKVDVEINYDIDYNDGN